MKQLLGLSRMVDALSESVGKVVYWLILVSVIVSSGNATVRYIFDVSSNGWLELQWYLFSAVFLLCAGYTLLHNQHVRIDIIISRLTPRGRAWIDLFAESGCSQYHGKNICLLPLHPLLLSSCLQGAVVKRSKDRPPRRQAQVRPCVRKPHVE